MLNKFFLIKVYSKISDLCMWKRGKGVHFKIFILMHIVTYLLVSIYFSAIDLAPGAMYVFKVYPFKGEFRGPDEKIEIQTQGLLFFLS